MRFCAMLVAIVLLIALSCHRHTKRPIWHYAVDGTEIVQYGPDGVENSRFDHVTKKATYWYAKHIVQETLHRTNHHCGEQKSRTFAPRTKGV